MSCHVTLLLQPFLCSRKIYSNLTNLFQLKTVKENRQITASLFQTFERVLARSFRYLANFGEMTI